MLSLAGVLCFARCTGRSLSLSRVVSYDCCVGLAEPDYTTFVSLQRCLSPAAVEVWCAVCLGVPWLNWDVVLG